jgi:hypothetical protein
MAPSGACITLDLAAEANDTHQFSNGYGWEVLVLVDLVGLHGDNPVYDTIKVHCCLHHCCSCSYCCCNCCHCCCSPTFVHTCPFALAYPHSSFCSCFLLFTLVLLLPLPLSLWLSPHCWASSAVAVGTVAHPPSFALACPCSHSWLQLQLVSCCCCGCHCVLVVLIHTHLPPHSFSLVSCVHASWPCWLSFSFPPCPFVSASHT